MNGQKARENERREKEHTQCGGGLSDTRRMMASCFYTFLCTVAAVDRPFPPRDTGAQQRIKPGFQDRHKGE